MTPPAGSARPATRPLRVLVAEAYRDAADSLAELLALTGCAARACYDGGAAVRAAAEFRPDVCVFDVGLRGGGLEAARRVRADAGGRPLLLVALAAVGGPAARDAARDAGFDRYVVKASDPQVMVEDLAAFGARLESAA